jgi:hypothetical protein
MADFLQWSERKGATETTNFKYLKGKGKVVPVRNLIKHYAMKAYGGVDV